MKTLLVFLLITNLSFGQVDKLLHASAGFVSSSVTTSVLQRYGVKKAVWIGFGVGACLGAGKEIYDIYSDRGAFEVLDAAYTIGGAVLGSITIKFAIREPKKQNLRRPKL